MSRVVWAEESKTGLGIKIGPSYDGVPTTSQCASAWQSSCIKSTEKLVNSCLRHECARATTNTNGRELDFLSGQMITLILLRGKSMCILCLLL